MRIILLDSVVGSVPLIINLTLSEFLFTRDAGRLEVTIKLSRSLSHEIHVDVLCGFFRQSSINIWCEVTVLQLMRYPAI